MLGMNKNTYRVLRATGIDLGIFKTDKIPQNVHQGDNKKLGPRWHLLIHWISPQLSLVFSYVSQFHILLKPIIIRISISYN